MKARSTVFAATVAAIVLAVSFAAAVSDGSSADGTGLPQDYYYGQLNSDEQKIFDRLEGLDLGTAVIKKEPTVGGGTAYYIEVAVSGITPCSQEVAGKEAENAWVATKLTDPMAWWTWSYDDAGVAVSKVSVSGSEISFRIMMAKQYASEGAAALKTMVEETETKISETAESLGITSSDMTAADKIETVNKYLCGSKFEYDPAVSSGKSEDGNPYNGSVYGAFVNAVDGKHIIVCSGYSAAFQALCMKAGVKCLSVFGTAAQSSSNGLHAWNVVELYGKVYGVDTTFNATGGDITAYLCAGALTEAGGVTFSQSHQPFSNNNVKGLYMGSFTSHAIEDEGYSWPADETFVTKMSEYAPWVIVGLICILLAYVLCSIGRKGDQQ